MSSGVPGSDTSTLSALLTEARVQTSALQEIVRTQSEHSEAFTRSNEALTKLLERQGTSHRSSGHSVNSEAVHWPTLAAILAALFVPLALLIGAHGVSLSSIGTEVDRWSTQHDRTFGPLATDHASNIDHLCERVQILSRDKGVEIKCPRALRPWPNGDRGGR